MKIVKKQVLFIIIALIVQVVVSFLISYFSNKAWSVSDLICNYIFLAFWGTYIIGTVFLKLLKNRSDKDGQA